MPSIISSGLQVPFPIHGNLEIRFRLVIFNYMRMLLQFTTANLKKENIKSLKKNPNHFRHFTLYAFLSCSAKAPSLITHLTETDNQREITQ